MAYTLKKNTELQYDRRELMCSAHGCPQRWSVDGSKGRLCSFHAWVQPHEWPRITEDLQRTGPWRLSTQEPINLKDEFRGDPRGWAKRLINRHEAGEKLNQTALAMAKEALHYQEAL